MKTESRCPRCGQVFGASVHSSSGRATCAGCGLAQRIPQEVPAHAVEPSCYQLGPMAVAPMVSDSIGPERRQAKPRKRHSARRAWLQLVRPWVFESSHVQGIGAWLVVLSAADLLMTFALLRRSELFFESNPIAQWFFLKWNITGMVFFKFSMIGSVILMSEIIERKRPGWGRFVLLVGCVGAAFAVLQGGRLYLADTVPVAVEMD